MYFIKVWRIVVLVFDTLRILFVFGIRVTRISYYWPLNIGSFLLWNCLAKCQWRNTNLKTEVALAKWLTQSTGNATLRVQSWACENYWLSGCLFHQDTCPIKRLLTSRLFDTFRIIWHLEKKSLMNSCDVFCEKQIHNEFEIENRKQIKQIKCVLINSYVGNF